MANSTKHLLIDEVIEGEFWEEYLRYLGTDQWELEAFCRSSPSSEVNEKVIEPFSTTKLIFWALESDAMGETSSDEDEDAEDEDAEDADDSNSKSGSRIERLLEIAKIVGAENCQQYLHDRKIGKWPPPPSTPDVLRVTGVGKRAVWTHRWHTVYCVETSSGPGFLYPTSVQGIVRLVLASSNTSDRGWHVTLSKEIAAELSQYQNEYDELSRKK